MKDKVLIGGILILLFLSVGLCSAANRVPNEDLIINHFYLGMDRNNVEKVIGNPVKEQKYGKYIEYVYERGQVKIIYHDNKVIRMKIKDRKWKNTRGLHCGDLEEKIKHNYGQPYLFSDHPVEKSYSYQNINCDSKIEFIAIDGYVQEIIVQKDEYFRLG